MAKMNKGKGGLPNGLRIQKYPVIEGVNEQAPKGEVADIDKQMREDVAKAKKQKSKRKF